MVRNILAENESPTDQGSVGRALIASRFNNHNISNYVSAAAAQQHSAHIPRLYKVPLDQRLANPDAYTPFLFSFGPYHAPALFLHYGSAPALQTILDGAHLKRLTAAGLLAPNPDDQINALIDRHIRQYEPQIRAQYIQCIFLDDSPAMPPPDFRRMLALDAITIVAATFSYELHRQYTPLIYPIARLVLSDAMLLENQVPIILLECALKTIAQIRCPPAPLADKSQQLPAVDHSLPTLEEVILWYCKNSNPFPEWTLSRLPPLEDQAKGEPLLAFLYDYISDHVNASQPSYHGNFLTKDIPTDVDPSLPTASHLARCGVRFRPCKTGEYILFDSENDVLFLPRITVSDTTVRVLHNLLAYEATLRHPKEYIFISYVHFIDCLIDNVDDVDILTASGIICNKLGSQEEVATAWNKLCMYVSCRNTVSNRMVMAQLDELSKTKWRQWRASFVDIYWEKQPWLLLSIFAAIVLFVLSLLQTIYTIMA